MDYNVIYNEDCLDTLKRLPDKSIDLVLTDPPYGINIGKMGFTTNLKGGVAKRNNYRGKADWDKEAPTQEFFDEMFRVSKNQLIFGGNFFADKLPISRGWIVWDKRTADKYSNNFADCEFIWTSFNIPARIIRYLWSGMLQGDMKNKERRVHPTQKPLPVIKRLVETFTTKGELIYDPFLGSGTTAVAAKLLGRQYLGSEISPEYYKIALERIAASDTV